MLFFYNLGGITELVHEEDHGEVYVIDCQERVSGTHHESLTTYGESMTLRELVASCYNYIIYAGGCLLSCVYISTGKGRV